MKVFIKVDVYIMADVMGKGVVVKININIVIKAEVIILIE